MRSAACRKTGRGRRAGAGGERGRASQEPVKRRTSEREFCAQNFGTRGDRKAGGGQQGGVGSIGREAEVGKRRAGASKSLASRTESDRDDVRARVVNPTVSVLAQDGPARGAQLL